jgi:hypothetical protein
MLGCIFTAITFLTIALRARAVVILAVLTVASSTVAIRTGTFFHGPGVLGEIQCFFQFNDSAELNPSQSQNLTLAKTEGVAQSLSLRHSEFLKFAIYRNAMTNGFTPRTQRNRCVRGVKNISVIGRDEGSQPSSPPSFPTAPLPCFPSLFTIPQISQNQHLPFYYLQRLT